MCLREYVRSSHRARRAAAGALIALISSMGVTEGAAAAGVTWSVPIDDVARALITTTGGVSQAWLADRDAAAAARVLDLAATSLAALAQPAHAQPTHLATQESAR